MQSTTTATRSSPIPRNYASTDLHATYPGSCFDFSDLLSFAALHPVETLDLDGDVDVDADINTCPSSTPCSETFDHRPRHSVDHDTPLELTYSASTAASSSSSMPSTSRSSSTSAPSPAMTSMAPTPTTTKEEEDIIDRVIRKLQGYSLGLGQEHDLVEMEEVVVEKRLDIAVGGSRRGSAMTMGIGTGMGKKPVVVSEEDSALWTRVWGSATAVRGARERRMRRMGRKALVKIGVVD